MDFSSRQIGFSKFMNLNHIVIGSGPTGLIVHSELKKSGSKGLVLEKGKKINSTINDIYTKEQLKNGYLYSGLNILWGNPLTLLSEGSCVGGGSTLNSSLHHRAPNFIWEKWRSKYALKGFDEERVDKIYSEIENLFDLNFTKSNMNDFFNTAKKFYKVQNIPRWGVEDDALNFTRTTGLTVAKKYDKDIEDDIISNYFIEKISYKSNNNIEIIGHEKIYNKEKLTFEKRSIFFEVKKLFICAGAGATPMILYKLGLRHKNLGRFQIHPSARISLVPKEEQELIQVIEPFQITHFLPKIMIGSSANREFLSKANFPYRDSRNIDFSQCQNYYAMAPSEQKGKIFFRGPLEGLRTYNLSNEALVNIQNGLKIIFDLAKVSNKYKYIYSPGGLVDLENNKEIQIKNFIKKTVKKTMSSVHIFSSAPAGENKALCPVNSDGSIDLLPNIHVMDSSLIPSCPTVNPQATACVFALSLIRGFLKK